MRTHIASATSFRLAPRPHAAPAGGPTLTLLANEPESPWGAMAFGEDVPPATLAEARAGRSTLARLLDREHRATADFLLADFDRRRAWEPLGHASLFAFLVRELGLSNGAAYLRSSAARLLPRFPAVEAALREGKLCLSAAGELARVLTAANEAEVLPRYFGCSAREAREVTAALLPRASPPRREVVTTVRAAGGAAPAAGLFVAARAEGPAPAGAPLARVDETDGLCAAPATAAPGGLALRAHEVGPTQPFRAPRVEVEPLSADLRRVHLTVSAGFLEKVSAAKTGLSHTMPRATMEQVLEAALDLLLARQAQRKGLGEKVRR